MPPYATSPLQGINNELGPNVKVNYAAEEIGNAAVKAARGSDAAIVVIGNDPTCGPDIAHDWQHSTVDGGDTLPCTVPSDGREGRSPNERRTVQIPVKASTLAYWDDKSAQLKVEAEPVRLMVGSSSADIKLSTTVDVC